ncbi:MAG: hypothetical protein HBSAPP04_19170 [Ignavibacteriaceae bacterium]|nr:MAG: hypothetical protein HBSAPP04_19170 [Ignavibacteriaceae bacterium]
MNQLTHDQQEILKKIEQFFAGDDRIFLLKGSAGTGKTTMIRLITEVLQKNDLGFSLMAPTGKAASVIQARTGHPARTIHSCIYSFDGLEEVKEDSKSNDDDDDVTPLYKFRTRDCSGTSISIVDEASMVSNNYSDSGILRFGSGYLLDDLISYSGILRGDLKSKIIFVGDPYQLSPVGSARPVALDAGYMRENYRVGVDEGELITPVRFGESPGILKNATFLRDRLISGVIGNLLIEENEGCSFLQAGEDVVDSYLEAFDQGLEAVMISSTNADTWLYNTSVRDRLYGFEAPLRRGEKLMIVQNRHFPNGVPLLNGDIVTVKKVFEPFERTVRMKRGKKIFTEVLHFRKIEIEFPGSEGEISVPVLMIEDLLFGKDRDLTRNQMIALYVDFIQRHKHLKRKSAEFAKALMSDEFFNALRVKFCHAITCHKAQGSEWGEVFVDPVTYHNSLSREYVRWLYTAVTRSRLELIMMSDRFHNGRTRLSLEEGTPELVPIQEVVAGSGPLEVLKTGVTEYVEGLGYFVVAITELQWRLRYSVKNDGADLSFDIIYNGAMKVTSVMFPESSTGEMSIPERRLREVAGRLVNKVFLAFPNREPEITGTPSDPAVTDVLIQRVERVISPSGASVRRIDHMPWRLRCKIADSENIMTADISYKKNGTPTAIEVKTQNSSSAEFAKEISLLISNRI